MAGALLGPAEIRDLAALLDLRPTKKLGQNFVIDGNTVRRIVGIAGVGADSSVVEIGPGLGAISFIHPSSSSVSFFNPRGQSRSTRIRVPSVRVGGS